MTSSAKWLTTMTALTVLLAGPAWGLTLSKDPSRNVLDEGSYRFAAYKAPWAGDFVDTWGFSLAKTSRVRLLAGSFDLSLFKFPLLAIHDLRVALRSGSSSGMNASGMSHATSASILLVPGLYKFDITGEVAGILGGKYIGNVDVSAVPLPPAFVAFGTALILLLAGRRLRPRWRGSIPTGQLPST